MEEYSWSADLKTSNVTLSNNNMTASVPSMSNAVLGSVGLTSGKWYWEISNLSGGNLHMIGVSDSGVLTYSGAKFLYPKSTSYYKSGNIYPENISYGMSFTISDVIGVAIDIDNNKIEFFKNGVPQGVYTGDDYSQYDAVHPFLTSGASAQGAVATLLVNENDFNYTIPEGYKPYGPQNENKILILSTSGDVYSVEKGSRSESKVPIMTNNTLPEGIASASSSVYLSNSSYYQPWRAFDGLIDNVGWVSSDNTYPQWLSYEFSTSQEIGAYSMVNRPATLTAMPKDWLFQGSDDGNNWEVLDERINVTDWEDGVFKVFFMQKKGNYKKYRIFINSNNGWTSYVAIAEVQMMSFNPSKIKSIPSQTEQDFINHGMDTTQTISPQEKVTQKQYINNTSTILGNGKVFKQPIDKYIKSLNVK